MPRSAFIAAALWTVLLMPAMGGRAQGRYPLEVVRTDKDTQAAPLPFALRSVFSDSAQCRDYVDGLVPRLRSMGHMAASVDSFAAGRDSARVWVHAGPVFLWNAFRVQPQDMALLESSGWRSLPKKGERVDLEALEGRFGSVVSHLANNGHPFASLRLDSIATSEGGMVARLAIDRGPLYRIDSISVDGGLRISRNFLHRYLDIPPGGVYRRDRLDRVGERLMELPWLRELRPWDMTLLGSGSTLNLHLEPQRNSQVNLLVGLLPDNSQIGGRLLLTGEANVRLRNAFGAGEGVFAEWQQIQVRSPRLRLAYDQPYVFGSPLGLDFAFDLFRKDSTFVNLNARIGVQYLVTSRQRGVVFFQPFVTNLLDVDTATVKAMRRLPSYADASASNLGVDYRYNGTDYIYNPRRGAEFELLLTGGWRTVRENPAIVALKTDASGQPFDFSSLYDTVAVRSALFRLRAGLAKYTQLSDRSTLKTALRAGWVLPGRRAYRNEVYQIGGYCLLRGFDEESIFATGFWVGTLEYRYLLGRNSFLFGFTDLGKAVDRSGGGALGGFYAGAGMGLSLETRAGIFNLAYAVGKREGLPLDLRQSKIHFGLVGLF